MDGEVDDLEMRRLLTEDNAEQVRNTWSRYQLLRESLRGSDEHHRFVNLDVSQRVSAAIACDSSPSQRAEPSSWVKAVSGFAVAASVTKAVSGFAVAASVTVAVIVGVQGVKPVSGGYNDIASATNSAKRSTVAPSPQVSSRVYAPSDAASTVSYQDRVGSASGRRSVPSVGPRATSQVVADLEAQKRLERYMLRHTEGAALNNGQGMISYARIAPSESP